MKIIKKDKVYKYDQFFTSPEAAKKCVSFFERKIAPLRDFDVVLEPSAGTCSFFELFPKKNRLGIEIDKSLCKKTPELQEGSFYDYIPSNGSLKYAVIGNPPFGTQNKDSVRFFNHAAKFAEVIAFIVPKTWKKNSVQNRLSLDFILVDSIDLESDCFIGAKNTTVKCCFQIWKRTLIPRKKIKLVTSHEDWDFLSFVKCDNGDVKPPKDPDFVVLAYGSNSGQVSRDINKWRPKSVHFVKAKIGVDQLISRFESLDYSNANNSARQSSLGRGELVKLYAERYSKNGV